MNLDKASWTKVRLADVVVKKEENDKENAKNRFDRFLKVEHLDAESLHIKRWSSQKDVELPPTFYKVFRKGQILFPTRNPHLRRAVLAHFDGICGEKTLTLDINSESALPEFLSFLFHSDAFYAFTTSSIIGSTNPHVRWRDVANFEFLLPPPDIQSLIAEMLWKGDKAIETAIATKKNLEVLLESSIEKEIHGQDLLGQTIDSVLKDLSKTTKLVKLGALGDIFKGKGIPKSEVSEVGMPCIRYGELYTVHHRIIRRFCSHTSEDSAKKAVKLKTNDILFAGSGETITEIGKSAAFIGNEDAYAGSDILIFRPNDMDGTYLGYLMNSQLVRQQLNKFGTGATVMHVYASDIEKIRIPKIAKEEQVRKGVILEALSENISLAIEKIEKTVAMQKNLINRVF